MSNNASYTPRYDEHTGAPDMDHLHMETAAINTLAGNLPNQGWAAAEHQIQIIESEFDELKAAIAAHDLQAMRDGIADLQFTLSGLAHRVSIPMAADWAEVVRSNYTKFDKSHEDAQKTHAKYQALGIETSYTEVNWNSATLYVTRSAKDQVVGGKNYPAGKWLKSCKFEDVVFEPLKYHPLGTDGTHPARLLAEFLNSEYHFRHAFIGAIQHMTRRSLTELDASTPAETFQIAQQTALNVYTLIGLNNEKAAAEINVLSIPPLWTGTWDELQATLPEAKAVMIPGMLAALQTEFQLDPAYAWSWHCNLAMSLHDAATSVANKLQLNTDIVPSYENRNKIAAALMVELLHFDTAPLISMF